MYGRNSRSNPFRYDGDAKPRREVFPTDEIPHKWAAQAQARARNAQGNLYFRGLTIYSYRDSWPLARIYLKGNPTKGGRRGNPSDYVRDCVLVLTNCARYSTTTSQHQDAVERAVSHFRQIAVPYLTPSPLSDTLSKDQHSENVAYLEKTAAKLLAKAQRAMRQYAVDVREKRARGLYADMAAYLKFFGIRRKAPVFPAEQWAAAQARIARILNPDPVRDARKIKAAAARKRRMQAALEACFNDYRARVATWNAAVLAAREAAALRSPEDIAAYWRTTGEWPKSEAATLPDGMTQPRPSSELAGFGPNYYYRAQRKTDRALFAAYGDQLPEVFSARGYDRPRDVLLRVAGEDIQTSLGARIPLAAAPMVWVLIQRARRNGMGWKPSGLHAVKIGDYSVSEVTAEGDLRAGCHYIKYGELERMARKLELLPEGGEHVSA